MALQFVLGQNILGPKGQDGNTIIGVRGPPDGSVGKLGDYAYDITNVVFYGPKTSATSWPAGLSLKGAKGDSTPQTLPQDFVANSFIVSPVPGDSAPVQYALKNAAGTVLFSVDSLGNIVTKGSLSAASSIISGNETIGGTLSVTGQTTLGATSTGALTAASLTSLGQTQSTGHVVTSFGTAAAPAFSFLGQTDTGLYLATASSSAASLALSVNGTNAFNLTNLGLSLPGTLVVFGVITGQSNLSIAGTAAITGAITGGATLTIAGAASVKSLTLTQSSAQDGNQNVIPALAFPGKFGGTGSYPASGISSDSLGNLLFSYQGRTVIAMANPGYNAGVGNTPSTAFSMAFSAGGYTFGAGGTTALAIGGNGSTTIGGGLAGSSFPCIITTQSGTVLSLRQANNVVGTFDAAGNMTLASLATVNGLTLSSAASKITFGDTSVQSTAYTAFLANNQTKWIATTNGTAALPVFTFSSNTDCGLYLKGQGAAAAIVALSVNATDVLTLLAGAASVTGTLGVTGATTLSGALSANGACTFAAVTASGLLKAPNITLTQSGGAITFADGTQQTTAASGGAGSAANFIATSTGTLLAPAFAFSVNPDTGWFLQATGTSTAKLALSVNQVNVFSATQAALTLSKPATLTGTTTLNGDVSYTGNLLGSSTSFLRGGSGAVSSPGISFAANTTAGLSVTGSGTSSVVSLSANATAIASFVATNSATSFAGPVTSTASVTSTSHFTSTANGSATNVQFGFNSQNGMYVNLTTPSLPVVGLSMQSTAYVVLDPNKGLLTPQGLSSAQSVTSTTPVGTPSFVSTQGFKSYYDMGSLIYAAGAALPSSATQLMRNGTAYNRSFVPAVATSVMGISIGIQQTLTTAINIQMNLNGTLVSVGTLAAGQSTLSVMYPKGTYNLAAGNYFFINASFASTAAQANPVQLDANALIEMGA